jgi:hypothetical protein
MTHLVSLGGGGSGGAMGRHGREGSATICITPDLIGVKRTKQSFRELLTTRMKEMIEKIIRRGS